MPPPANGGEPAQVTATTVYSGFTLRLPGPFSVRVRIGLSPSPDSLAPRLDAYFSRSPSFTTYRLLYIYHILPILSNPLEQREVSSE